MPTHPTMPLAELYRRSLEAASKSANLHTIDKETQEIVQSALRDLQLLHARIRELSLFSPNELLDDISTRDLVYLTLPYVLAEVENRVRTTERAERMSIILQAVGHYQAFVHQLEHYAIIPADEKKLYSDKSSMIIDPARRREAKVNQYRKTREIKDRIRVLQKRRNIPSLMLDSYSQSDFDLIASLLPSSPQSISQSILTADIELDSETDEILRTTTTFLLRMLYAQTQTHLESMEQELELLRRAPPNPSDAPREDQRVGNWKSKTEQEQMWKVDLNVSGGLGGQDGKGPLLDQRGRPLRPFTILPSNVTERTRLQAQVFGPGYNLPTMTMDEYLHIEKERGNILTGGGPKSLEQPTSSEQLQINSEMEGTAAGEEKAEEKRQKDERWAQYKDTHPRGAGNTMNRG